MNSFRKSSRSCISNVSYAEYETKIHVSYISAVQTKGFPSLKRLGLHIQSTVPARINHSKTTPLKENKNRDSTLKKKSSQKQNQFLGDSKLIPSGVADKHKNTSINGRSSILREIDPNVINDKLSPKKNKISNTINECANEKIVKSSVKINYESLNQKSPKQNKNNTSNIANLGETKSKRNTKNNSNATTLGETTSKRNNSNITTLEATTSKRNNKNNSNAVCLEETTSKIYTKNTFNTATLEETKSKRNAQNTSNATTLEETSSVRNERNTSTATTSGETTSKRNKKNISKATTLVKTTSKINIKNTFNDTTLEETKSKRNTENTLNDTILEEIMAKRNSRTTSVAPTLDKTPYRRNTSNTSIATTLEETTSKRNARNTSNVATLEETTSKRISRNTSNVTTSEETKSKRNTRNASIASASDKIPYKRNTRNNSIAPNMDETNCEMDASIIQTEKITLKRKRGNTKIIRNTDDTNSLRSTMNSVEQNYERDLSKYNSILQMSKKRKLSVINEIDQEPVNNVSYDTRNFKTNGKNIGTLRVSADDDITDSLLEGSDRCYIVCPYCILSTNNCMINNFLKSEMEILEDDWDGRVSLNYIFSDDFVALVSTKPKFTIPCSVEICLVIKLVEGQGVIEYTTDGKTRSFELNNMDSRLCLENAENILVTKLDCSKIIFTIHKHNNFIRVQIPESK